MSEEQTIISPSPAGLDIERTQVAIAPGADVTQAAVVIQCPVCHTANPPGDRWCLDCGFLLTAPAPEALEELPSGVGPRLVQDGREFELHAGANTIGRVVADVLLLDSTVSRHHATLTIAEDGAWIEDVGSTNGTYLNGAPVAPGNRTRVQDGDTLKLGSITVKLAWPEGAAALPASGPGEGAAPVPGGVPAAPAVALLVAADGQEYALQAGVTTLGRRAENAIVVSGDAYVSGRHAEIRCDDGGCVLVDVGSTNGTFHRTDPTADWERLRPHDPRPLSPGDELRLGQSTFNFQAAPMVAEPTTDEAVGEPAEPADEEPLPAVEAEEQPQ
jgi:pSer/pThr/pTyr-binding forkhead associated (FHA) protein